MSWAFNGFFPFVIVQYDHFFFSFSFALHSGLTNQRHLRYLEQFLLNQTKNCCSKMFIIIIIEILKAQRRTQDLDTIWRLEYNITSCFLCLEPRNSNKIVQIQKENSHWITNHPCLLYQSIFLPRIFRKRKILLNI